MKTAIVMGSFDPVTIGHYDIIKRAKALFPKVIVVVLDNSEKNFLFSSEKRFMSVKACFSDDKDVSVILWNGLFADLVLQTENPVIVRGARTAVDFEYERMLHEINRELSGAETVILPSKRENEYISSTFVRELIKYNKPLAGYVPDKAIEVLGKN
ncbi:MAG: pantetheine-phosphate adenylyltransferase [Eubacteriales bacterium]|nr:pantetheine-phosphate adenylyltransferase [Eubacteriales bacterium]MDD4422109.1 pantetheine-phosphate adenylyltransferase [Eubacteriales bacterium]